MTEQTTLIGPARVPVERIDELMASLKIHCLRYPGTTTTVAIACLPGVGDLPGFTVAEGHAFCTDPLDFDARIGVQQATANVKERARAVLWTLENYMLWTQRIEHAMDAGLRFSVAPPRPLHQQRVIDEKEDLDVRTDKLAAFIGSHAQPGPVFGALPQAEQIRMVRQLELMRQLSAVLGERIASFP